MADKRFGIIIFSHGSKRASWALPFREIAFNLDQTFIGAEMPKIQVAFLEGASPNLMEAVQELHMKGVDRVGIVPLFLTASVHLLEDVPEEIGRVSKHFETEIQIEQLWDTPLASSITPGTLARSTREGHPRDKTAVVLPYYGSSKYAKTWEEILERISRALLDSGFAAVLPAPVGHIVGASPVPTSEAIQRGLRQTDWVHVVPFLLSPGIFQHEIIPAAIALCGEKSRERIHYTPDGILPDPFVEAAIEDRVRAFLGA